MIIFLSTRNKECLPHFFSWYVSCALIAVLCACPFGFFFLVFQWHFWCHVCGFAYRSEAIPSLPWSFRAHISHSSTQPWHTYWAFLFLIHYFQTPLPLTFFAADSTSLGIRSRKSGSSGTRVTNICCKQQRYMKKDAPIIWVVFYSFKIPIETKQTIQRLTKWWWSLLPAAIIALKFLIRNSHPHFNLTSTQKCNILLVGFRSWSRSFVWRRMEDQLRKGRRLSARRMSPRKGWVRRRYH